MDDLLEWLTTHRLSRHKARITDENSLGLATLDDLRMLSEEDIHDVSSICAMNIGERNRFRAEVRRLQGKEAAPPSDAQRPAPAPAPAQAPFPDRGAAGARQPAQVPAPAQAPSPRRVGSPSPRSAAGASPRLAGEAVSRTVDASSPRAAATPSRRGPQELPVADQQQQEEVDWYEVVSDMVVVKGAPKLQAKDLGCMWQGDRIQCKLKKFYDREGRTWVELAPSQMLASCKACRDPLAQGFALLDGTHLGLGLQLRSLPSGGAPEPQVAPTESEHAGAVQESAPSRAADLSDESDEDASTAGPKAPRGFRPSPFRAQPRGAGPAGGAGEEELLRQQARHCACEESEDARKAARRARAERMQRAQALAAAKRAKEEERLRLTSPMASDDDEAAEEREAARRRRAEAQWSRDDALEALRHESEDQVRREQALRQRATAYRAAYDFVYAMPPGDPSAGSIRRLECQPGAAFYTTGERWQGPQGGVWLARAGPGPGSGCRGVGWLLLHSPDAGEERPWLLREEEMQGRVRVQVKYLSHLQSFRVFESCLTGRATVRALKSRLCGETGLRAGSVVLLHKEYAACRSDLSENEEGLPDHTTLAELGLSGEVHLYLLYTSDFEEHYRSGYLLRLQQK